jgi:pilus assembly protein Flp/PilA
MLNRLCAKVHALMLDQKGVTAIEYGLIAALIAVAAVGAMQVIGGNLSTTFTNVSNNLK